MRISDWSSDVCSSDLPAARREFPLRLGGQRLARPFGISLCVLERDVDDGVVHQIVDAAVRARRVPPVGAGHQCPPLTEIVERHRRGGALENERGGHGEFGIQIGIEPGIGRYFRSEEHTSELQSLMRISYAVFCLKKKKNTQHMIPCTTYTI